MRPIINVDLNTSTFTEVKNTDSQPCSAYAFRARAGNDIQFKSAEADITYYTLTNGQSIGYTEYVPKDHTICWAKSIGSADVLELTRVR